MRVVTLLENRTLSQEFIKAHGLSLYIETEHHKILFDMGPNAGFIENAKKLGVSLEAVDIAIVSHGHYDHGGGLKDFLALNKKAKIYIGKEAFDKHIVKVVKVFKADIGIEPTWYEAERFVKVDGLFHIDEELTVFNQITERNFVPLGNKRLLKEFENGDIRPDDFNHEINLLIHGTASDTLLCGCAHKGIANILEKAKTVSSKPIKHVIGGFHLRRTNTNKGPGKILVDGLVGYLGNEKDTQFYTCHCTGEETYLYMKKQMSNLDEIKTGSILDLEG